MDAIPAGVVAIQFVIRRENDYERSLKRLSESLNPDGTVDISEEIWNKIVDALLGEEEFKI